MTSGKEAAFKIGFGIFVAAYIGFLMGSDFHYTKSTTTQEFCKCPVRPDPDIVLPGSSPSAMINIPPQDPNWGKTLEGIEAEKKRLELIEQTPEYQARVRAWVDQMKHPFQGIQGLDN